MDRQCPPIQAKNTVMNGVGNDSCVKISMTKTPLSKIEKEKCCEDNIVRKVYNGVYIRTCKLTNIESNYTTSHGFFYRSHFKLLRQKKWCGALVDNIKSASICVLGENYIESKHNLKKSLINLSCYQCMVKYV